jgi:hypothetical protein
VRGRRLYESIGELRHRHRRAVPARRVPERLMRLDALLAEPTVQWLASEAEKVHYLRSLAPALSAEGLSGVGDGSSARGFRLLPSDVLVGIGEAKPMLVYVGTSANEDDWRRVLAECGRVLATLPWWVFRAYFPPELKPQLSRFHFVFQEELGEPVSTGTLDDLRWYFEQLRTRAPVTSRRDRERFRDCQVQLLISARYRLLYQRWRAHGEAAFELASSRVIAEHLARHTGQMHCLLLPVAYPHAASIVTPPAPSEDRIDAVDQAANDDAAQHCAGINLGPTSDRSLNAESGSRG